MHRNTDYSLGRFDTNEGGSSECIWIRLETGARFKYQITKHAGLALGVNYLNADISIDDPDLKTEVVYGLNGGPLGLDIRFLGVAIILT